MQLALVGVLARRAGLLAPRLAGGLVVLDFFPWPFALRFLARPLLLSHLSCLCFVFSLSKKSWHSGALSTWDNQRTAHRRSDGPLSREVTV